MPYDRWPYNRMGEIEGRLVVGGYDCNLHVLTSEHDKWDKFVRKNGDIRNVVCHQGVCLMCVKDGDKDQFVIEQFHLNEDKKWRFLTVLPNELQLYGVSVALHDNSLYVVGGRTESGEIVNTARVCDLHSGHWYKMDDMQTKRSSCSSVIINNTVFVGGGKTDGPYFSNIVECADVRDRKWRTIPSTTTYWPTLTSVSNRLVGTGGDTQQHWLYSSLSNIVELYDERSTKWLPLPLMTHKRVAHAAFSTQNGELITAGGAGGDYSIEYEDSIESLKCD
ncbi:kelch-like protein 40 [Corticium candelabrum]|uniref:kelch-like protein 40 n=1 Tax=Corticium candelabrum TaxID=121492 RepID=UPI002E25F824|nr:kelch-like protein 40 [Corticium candelabrum]